MKIGLRLGNPYAAAIAIVFCLGVAFAAYEVFSSAIKHTKFSLVIEGKARTVAQVEDLMGRPNRIDHAESTGITGDVYHYTWKEADLKVVFVNGTVFHAEYVPEAKS